METIVGIDCNFVFGFPLHTMVSFAGIVFNKECQHRPVAMARGMPSRKPLRVVSGVLNSPSVGIKPDHTRLFWADAASTGMTN
ncbi:MAG: hypothetical protein ABFS43_19570 [Thermodesulfobacteriota bacterium]